MHLSACDQRRGYLRKIDHFPSAPGLLPPNQQQPICLRCFWCDFIPCNRQPVFHDNPFAQRNLQLHAAQPLYVRIRPHKLLVPQMPERRHSSWTIWLIDKEIYFRAVVFDIPREDFRIRCFKHRLLEAQSIANEALSLRLREEDFERWLFHWQANYRGQLVSDV